MDEDFTEWIKNATMENLPRTKRFFPSKELVWCLKQIENAGMPFKFPEYTCRKCHGRGYVGILNTPIYVGEKDVIRKPIPCQCLLEKDVEKLKAYARARGTKTGSPDANFNARNSG